MKYSNNYILHRNGSHASCILSEAKKPTFHFLSFFFSSAAKYSITGPDLLMQNMCQACSPGGCLPLPLLGTTHSPLQ